MAKKFLHIILTLFFVGIVAAVAFADLEVTEEIEPFSKTDRILVMAPHPDDETIGCAGVIQRALKQGASVRVAYLTNGDHNEFAFLVFEKRPIFLNREFIAMGEAREHEAKKAMGLLGLKDEDLIFLGYPDYGTDTIFFSYWGQSHPFSSYLTRQPYVPYKESPSYGAPYKGEAIVNDIKRILLDYKPNKIFISHPADVNGDHWAYYLFLQIALRDLRGKIPVPKLYVYFVHGTGWPLPRHYHPKLALGPSEKHFPEAIIEWKKLKLTDEEIDKKYKAMLAYRSQTCVSAFYLLSFVRQNELFGDYPPIELKKQHQGKVIRFFESDKHASYALVDDYLWIRVRKPRELKNRLQFSFYVFGYRDGVPYDRMPNIWISTKFNKVKVREMKLGKELDPQGTTAVVAPDFLTLKIPLKLLGGPDFVLASTWTDKTFLPFESTGFRRIELIE